ncbi:MAG: helix-turn-helix transcriptional regulator [Bacilli bacterium]
MTVFDRIKILADKKGISVSKAASDIGFSENLFYQWKTSSPKSDRLQLVADYFGVSTDYLLGRTDNPYLGQTDDQRERTVQEALDSVMSYDGEPLTDNDREVLKRIVEAYLDGKN